MMLRFPKAAPLLAVTSLIALTAVGFHSQHPSTALAAAYKGCLGCKPDGCQLDRGDYLGGVISKTNVFKCVDYDRDGVGHCAIVGMIEREIWHKYPGKYPEVIGYCFTTDCLEGTPQTTVCKSPWTNPITVSETGITDNPVIFDGTAIPLNQQPEGCSANPNGGH